MKRIVLCLILAAMLLSPACVWVHHALHNPASIGDGIAGRHGYYPSQRVPQYERTPNERCYSRECESYDVRTGKTDCRPSAASVRCWHQFPPDRWEADYTPIWEPQRSRP